jgi:hypothetical protein
MPTNINCKKKWHPSRHEVQRRVEAAERARKREKEAVEMRKMRSRRGMLEEDVGKNLSSRMSWMLP